MESIPPRRPTLKGVADAAGVSVATASRVLGGKSASPRAIAAVQAASRRLGYRPDPIARALRARSTGTFGVVVPALSNPFFAELISAVEDAAQQGGVEVLIADSHGRAEHEEHRLETLVDRRVDGILISPADENHSAKALEDAARSVPVVQIDRYVPGLRVDYVGVDSQRGIQELLGHLKDLGCRRLQFVSATPTNSTARARRDAFDSISRDLGFRADESLLGEFSIDYGRVAARQIVSRDALPDAVVCGSDVIAAGLMSEMSRLGIGIPSDLRVTGFDGIALADLTTPRLTTLRQPVEAIASQAVERLFSRLADPGSPSRQSIILPTLVIRSSTTGVAHVG
jgi:LacI family transcriptional regulator